MGMNDILKASADALEAAHEAISGLQQKNANLEASLAKRPAVDSAKVGQVVDALIAKGLHKEAERDAVTAELMDPDKLAQKCAALATSIPGTGSKNGARSFGRSAREIAQGNEPKKSDEVWNSHFGN